jgi:hypothetical protein
VAQGKVAGLVSTKAEAAPRPVRITFYNLLPAGSAGDLLLPVDESVPGAGLGPSVPGSQPGEKYSQNRATVHLHGNNTVWISDGNTHQWITPATETAHYPAGVSARNVPDMGTACDADAVNAPGLPGVVDPVTGTAKSSGCMTFFYTNAQSARLQFYHDHAHGITRLNVYAGEAAGYVLTDAVEQDMINGTNITGVNPGFKMVLPGLGIPLVIQDKTWVDAQTVYAQDPTWDPAARGTLRPATSGTRTSTCRSPIPGIRPERTPSAAGSTVHGSTRLPRSASTEARTGASSRGRCRIRTTRPTATWSPRGPAALRPGSRRSIPACRIRPSPVRASSTRRR